MSNTYDAASEDGGKLAIDAEGVKAAASRGSFVIATAQVIKAAMMFGSQLVLARLLLPADFGLVAMVAPIIALATIINSMGLGEALVQRRQLDQDRIAGVFWGSAALSVVIGCVLAALAPLIAHVYGDVRLSPLLLLAGASLPVGTLGSVPSALLIREMRFRYLQANEIVTTALGLIVTISLAMNDFGVWSLPLGALTGTIASIGSMWSACGWRPTWPKSWHGIVADLSFGANLTAATLAGYLTTTADNIIIGGVCGSQALGYYDRSYRLVVQPIGQLLAPFAGVAVPLLSRLRPEPAHYSQSYFRLLRASLVLSLPPAIISIVLGDRLMPLLLGTRWAPAGATFQWIALGGVASGLYSSLTWLFVSQDRTTAMRNAFIAAAGINVASFVIGVFWGIEGVAACGAIGFVTITTPLVTYFATRGGLVSAADLAKCIAPYGIGVVCSIAALWLVKPFLPAAPTIWLPVSTIVLFVFASAPVIAVRSERTELFSVIAFALHRLRLSTARFTRVA